MPLAPDTDNLVIGRGAVYFDREDAAGNPTGELDLGNATTFPLRYAATLKEHFSSRRGVKKRDLIRINEEKFSIDITLEEYSKENLILAICGDKVEYLTQSAGTGAASFKASRGRWLDTGYRSISNITVSHGATIFSIVNDYLVDPQGGRIMPLSTGAIYENEELFVSFDYSAINQPILKASQREVFGMLRFVPANVVGPNWELKAWRVQLKLKDEVQFIANDWGKIQLTAEINADAERHPTEPYFTMTDGEEAAPSDPRALPILHWPGDDTADEIIAGLGGVWTGAPAYTPGVEGNAFNFETAEPGSSYVTVPHDNLLNFAPTGQFSISFYFKLTSLSWSGQLMTKRITSAQTCWALWCQNNGRIYIARDNGTSVNTGIIPGFALDAWIKLFAAYTNKRWKIYTSLSPFTDELIYTTPSDHPIGQNTGSMYFGGVPGGGGTHTAIQKIKFYDAAYLPTQVK